MPFRNCSADARRVGRWATFIRHHWMSSTRLFARKSCIIRRLLILGRKAKVFRGLGLATLLWAKDTPIVHADPLTRWDKRVLIIANPELKIATTP